MRIDSFPEVDRDRLLSSLRALAADSMEGRRAGTRGGTRARAFLLREFARIGLEPAVVGFASSFSGRSAYLALAPVTGPDAPLPSGSARTPMPVPWLENSQVRGINLLGVVHGTVHPDRFIVVSAHYDHVGVQHGQIFNGADDNASGTAAILAIAEWFVAHPPQSSIIFAWFDAEEYGMVGSTAFVGHPPVPLNRIVANVNVDMVSRDKQGVLYAAGTRRYPIMRAFVNEVAAVAPVTLSKGHDVDGAIDDWTHRSDEGPFHDKQIPFVHFGVEEHEDYHRPTDDFENIQPEFYYRSVRTIAEFIRRLDARLDAVERVRDQRERPE